MGLSRLDNFLKSSRGTILYVNPNDLDATDSIENQGNSLTRPFKTIQRALIEASRFSYQRGLNNDRFGKTTILLYPGDHTVDNRPGYIPDGVNLYRTRSGAITNDLPPYDLTSNLSLESPENELYKLNSIHGGVIVPRGTSIVGLDFVKLKLDLSMFLTQRTIILKDLLCLELLVPVTSGSSPCLMQIQMESVIRTILRTNLSPTSLIINSLVLSMQTARIM